MIRDDRGEFIYGYTHQYTHTEVIHAELQAIVDGLIHLDLMGMENVVIEI